MTFAIGFSATALVAVTPCPNGGDPTLKIKRLDQCFTSPYEPPSSEQMESLLIAAVRTYYPVRHKEHYSAVVCGLAYPEDNHMLPVSQRMLVPNWCWAAEL